MKWLIKGGRLFDPSSNLDQIADVLIENGKIKGIGKSLSVDGAQTFEMGGKLVVPGFFDMHVHLREPGREDKETIETGTRAAARGGFTSVACMPNTIPPLDNVTVLQLILSKAANSSVNVYPIACVSKGSQGEELSEMIRLHQAGAVAFSDDGKPVKTAELMRRALEYSKMLNVPIIDHCEESTLSHGVMHEGYYSTKLGLGGIPSESESIIVMRDLALAELTGGKVHIAHASTAQSIELIRQAKERGVNVTAEVTIHHLLLTDQCLASYDPNYKINPPLRSEQDREALLEGFKNGVIDCVVSDHAPHTREEKDKEFDDTPFGISGVEILVPLLLSEVVKKNNLPLKRAIESLSIRPYQILGLRIPQLKEGNDANLTILNLDAKEVIDVPTFESKGKNSPYHGKEVQGLPVMSIRKGEITMQDRKVTTLQQF